MLVWCQAVLAAQEAALDSGLVNPGYHEKPAWFKESFLDIREDIGEAQAAGKRVMLYFYQDGCPYCAKLLRDNFGQRRIADKTRKYFDIIAINLWGDREVTDLDGTATTEKQFAAARKVMFTPTLLFLDEKGGVVLRANGYYHPPKFEAALDYVGQHMEGRLAFRDYLKTQVPRAAAGKFHDQPFLIKPPLDLQAAMKKSDKPLLVMFEQKQCRECDELHTDILTRDATLREVEKLNVVQLDIWGTTPVTTPVGNKTTASAWARELDVHHAPSLVFFDVQGKQVFRTEAYLKAFHLQSVMDYVSSGAYREQPSFQRYIATRADRLEAQGVHVELME
ncbi:MAG: thioredoxin fold domain-containing protein [Pseudomonadota bacterium]|nr:MAG: thioredoxin fold domain-containing protein [Pseudomonadota bacterium]